MSKINHLMMYFNGTKSIGMRFVTDMKASAIVALVYSSDGLHQSGHGHWGLLIKLYDIYVFLL